MSELEILENVPKETALEGSNYLLKASVELAIARTKGNTKDIKSALAKVTYGVMKGIKNSGINWISLKDLVELAIEEEKNQKADF